MQNLISYFDINAQDQALAAQMWPIISDHAPDIIENFYRRSRDAGTGLVISDTIINHLKLKQTEHWRSLFGSEFDQTYFNRASLVGIKHREIGLDPKWYIAGYTLMKLQLLALILAEPLPASDQFAMIATLDKYVALDTALAVSSYASWLLD